MTPSISPLRASPQKKKKNDCFLSFWKRNLQTLFYWCHHCKIAKWSSWSRCGLCTCTVNAATVLYFRAESWWHWSQDFKPPVARRHLFYELHCTAECWPGDPSSQQPHTNWITIVPARSAEVIVHHINNLSFLPAQHRCQSLAFSHTAAGDRQLLDAESATKNVWMWQIWNQLQVSAVNTLTHMHALKCSTLAF